MNEIATIILGFTLPCLMTTLGAVLVFFFNHTSKIVNMLTIGLAAGIMLSASIWSLLVPALENAKEILGNLSFLPVVFGFILGGAMMLFMDFVSSKLYQAKITNQKFEENTGNLSKINLSEVSGNSKQKAFKMFTAITIHNIPEGLSVGFAIGTAIAIGSPLLSSFMFALGIALQNFPEGLATALPIYSALQKKGKSFLLATLSGLVEPIFAIAGFFLAAYITSLLPWLLAFSAGAMIYVIVEEMIPEIQMSDKGSWGTWAFVIGFVVMMVLDICL